jgi:hypothetical protein
VSRGRSSNWEVLLTLVGQEPSTPCYTTREAKTSTDELDGMSSSSWHFIQSTALFVESHSKTLVVQKGGEQD